MALLERREGDRLELLGDLDVLGAELLRDALEDPGARVLRPVDAVTEAHDPLARREGVLYPLARIAELLDLLQHRLDVRGGASMERPGQRADRRGERRAAVGPGRSDHARRERGGVEAVLRGADPVRVDRLDVPRIRLAPPAEQELLRCRLAPRDDLVRDRLASRRRRSRAERATIAIIWPDSRPRSSRAWLVRDLVELPELPLAREASGLRLQVGGRVPGEAGRLVRLRARASSSRGRRRPAIPRRSRTGIDRRGPRCPRRGSAATRRRDPARRSRSRRRRRPRAQA